MQPENMILVSVDDHLVEPPNPYENACRWYSFDPFEHRTRDHCTVGALRAEAGDHDVEIRSFDHGRFTRTAGATLGSVSAKLNV